MTWLARTMRICMLVMGGVTLEAGAADRVAMQQVLEGVRSTCAQCRLDVTVEGPRPVDGRPEPFIAVGNPLRFEYMTEEAMHLLAIHVDSHGIASIVDIAETRPGAVLRSDEFDATEPVGTETLYVFASPTPFELPAGMTLDSSFSKVEELEPLAASLQRHPGPLVMRRARYVVEDRQGKLRGLVRQVIKAPDQGGGSASASTAPGDSLLAARIVVPLPLEFRTGSAELDASARSELDVFGEVLARLRRNSWLLHLTGHTDDVGADEYNLDLSRRRAQSARTYLIQSFGIPAAAVIADGRGESRPVAQGTDPVSRQKNRRVEFEFIDLSQSEGEP
jgi:outer membrane protein OmpA-like peptidoglycan-associated protein